MTEPEKVLTAVKSLSSSGRIVFHMDVLVNLLRTKLKIAVRYHYLMSVYKERWKRKITGKQQKRAKWMSQTRTQYRYSRGTTYKNVFAKLLLLLYSI